MYKPVLASHRNLLDRIEKVDIETDINFRWENGLEHHSRSEELAHLIGDLDWLFTNDYFCWKFGGDGDNGETLMFLLDILFDLEDAEETFNGTRLA